MRPTLATVHKQVSKNHTKICNSRVARTWKPLIEAFALRPIHPKFRSPVTEGHRHIFDMTLAPEFKGFCVTLFETECHTASQTGFNLRQPFCLSLSVLETRCEPPWSSTGFQRNKTSARRRSSSVTYIVQRVTKTCDPAANMPAVPSMAGQYNHI